MRNESGMALVMVMGLLVVLSLIGVGLISQTIINTKFYEALGTSYKGVPIAQADFTTRAIATNGVGELIVGLGTRPSDGKLATIIYGRKGAQEAWRPDLSQPFSNIAQTYPQPWTVDQTTRQITSTFSNTSSPPKDEERYFLFKDDSGVLKCWTSYDLYLEFAVPSPPNTQSTSIVPMSWGVYYNAEPVNVNENITGYIFQISPENGKFSVVKVANNTQTGVGDRVDITSILPYTWHSVEISVRPNPDKLKQDIITARFDGVEMLAFLGISNPHLDPFLIGLSHWSGKNEPTSSVTFRNISVTNATP